MLEESKDQSRAQRAAVLMRPEVLDAWSRAHSPWHETEAEVARGLTYGLEKARLLKWVRRQMGRRLTPRERHCIELYYFEALTYQEMGARTNTNASSAFRAVQRGLRKLRIAAREDGPNPPPRRWR